MSELTWKKEEKMTMTDEQLLELARLSVDGEINRHSIDQFCQTYPDITEEEKKGFTFLKVPFNFLPESPKISVDHISDASGCHH